MFSLNFLISCLTFPIAEIGRCAAFPVGSGIHLPAGGSCHGCLVGCDYEDLISNTHASPYVFHICRINLFDFHFHNREITSLNIHGKYPNCMGCLGKKVKLELNMCIYVLAGENRIKASYIFPNGERYGEWQMIQFNILRYTSL